MKPDWKDAPEWAKWLAMDGDGWWYWYARKPIKDDAGWHSEYRYSSVYKHSAAPSSPEWWETREQRPTDE